MKKNYLVVMVAIVLGVFLSSCKEVTDIMSALDAETIEGAEYVGRGSCNECHSDIVQRYSLSSHSGNELKETEDIRGESCESCHGPASLHIAGGGDKEKIFRYSQERCFACHIDKRTQFNLQYHHPVIEDRMTCMDCHDLHGTDKVNSSTALDRPDEKCFTCHKEMKGPFVFEHDAMREGCQICHEPHGTPYDKMLVAGQTSLCIRCHWEQKVNTAGAAFGGVSHGSGGGNYDIGRGEECIDHHRAPHGSNIWRTLNR